MNDSSVGKTVSSTSANAETDIRELLAIFLDEWLWIAGLTVAALLIALLYVYAATPVYRTNALIQVEEKSSGLGALGELSAVLAGEMPTEAEIEIVKSRAVLGAAVSQRGLETIVEPSYFPVIGAAISRRYQGPDVAPSKFGLDRYAWGGERIQVMRFSVPRSLVGEELTLVAGANNDFTISLDARQLLSGTIGDAVEESGISIYISELRARPGTRFMLKKLSWLEALAQLRENLHVTELGKKTGILNFSLDGADPAEIAATLDAVSETYLRQNVERTSEDAAKTLAFLEQQLPELKVELDAAEAALNSYRVRQGTIDLSLETQGLLEQVGEIEKQFSELELKHAELAQRFTSEHPVLLAIEDQRRELAGSRAAMEQQIRELPAAEQDSLRLMRDVRVANELYLLLLNRAQELKVVRAGTVGNVRIIDTAFEPVKPVKPNKPLVLSLALALGLIGGIFTVSAREAFNPMIRDSEDLEKSTGLPVYAIVPHSEQEESLNMQSGKAGEARGLLFSSKSDDVAIESLRSLRTSLEFLLLDAKSNVITIGGPAPGAGKSFVSANLAALFAQSGHKVLLIDADLRRGHLHRLLSLDRVPGISEVVRDVCPSSEALHQSVVGQVDFLSTGTIPPNPSELISSSRFEKLLQDLSSSYEIVLLDAPPVLGAAEAVTLARHSAINLMVVRSGEQTPREVELALNKLRQAGADINGFVLNDLPLRSRRHTYAGYHYYRYSQSKK